MIQYVPKPYQPFWGDIDIQVNVSNYETKTDLKNGTGVDKLLRIKESKAEVDKIDVYKIKTVPVDSSKLNNVVNNDVKKTVYDKLVVKVNNTDTKGFVLKTEYDTDKSSLEKKTCDPDKKNITGLVKKQIIMLQLHRSKAKYLVLLVYLLLLHWLQLKIRYLM